MPIDDLPTRRSPAGKSAVITGGASGIGLPIARLFLSGDESACCRAADLPVDGGGRV